MQIMSGSINNQSTKGICVLLRLSVCTTEAHTALYADAMIQISAVCHKQKISALNVCHCNLEWHQFDILMFWTHILHKYKFIITYTI